MQVSKHRDDSGKKILHKTSAACFIASKNLSQNKDEQIKPPDEFTPAVHWLFFPFSIIF